MHKINMGVETLFWKDHCLEGRTPMYLWLKKFYASQRPNDIVHEHAYLLQRTPFRDNIDLL